MATTQYSASPGHIEKLQKIVEEQGQGTFGASGTQNAYVDTDPSSPTYGTIVTYDAPSSGSSKKPKSKSTPKPAPEPSGPLGGLKKAAPSPTASAPATPAPATPEDVTATQRISSPMSTTPVEGPGGGAIGGGTPGLNWMSGPSALREGIGQRTMPNYSMILAGLGRAY